MHTKPRDLLHRNSIFGWIALATGLFLLIPLIAMQFSEEVNWDGTDFLVMGMLLYRVRAELQASGLGVPCRARGRPV